MQIRSASGGFTRGWIFLKVGFHWVTCREPHGRPQSSLVSVWTEVFIIRNYLDTGNLERLFEEAPDIVDSSDYSN